LSLYNSVAMLHYHVHGTSSLSTEPIETVIPFPTGPADLTSAIQFPRPSESVQAATSGVNDVSPTSTGMVQQASEDTSTQRSPSSSPPESPARATTRVLPASQPLEEFHAVEKAILASPYILPQDLLLDKPNPSSPKHIQQPSESTDVPSDQTQSSKTKDETTSDSMTSKEEEFFAELKMRGSQGRSLSKPLQKALESSMAMSAFTEINADDADISDNDSLADLVEDYSFRDNEDGDLQSSPFLEHTRPRTPILEDDEELSLYLKSPPPSPQRSFLPQKDEKTSSEMEERMDGQGNDGAEQLKRNTSVQRKGQEYLAQFLARRNPSVTTPLPVHPTTQSASPLLRRRNLRISPTTILLSILVLLSLSANIFLFTKLYEYQTPQTARLDDIMSPGKVGKTFDIFTPTTKWWQLYHLRNDPVEVIPVAVPSRAARISHSWRHVWETGWSDWNDWTGWKGWGGHRRKRIRWRHEERVIDILGQAQIVVYGVLQRVLGL